MLLLSEDIKVKRDCVLRGLGAYLSEANNTLIKEYLVSIRTSTMKKYRETSHTDHRGALCDQ